MTTMNGPGPWTRAPEAPRQDLPARSPRAHAPASLRRKAASPCSARRALPRRTQRSEEGGAEGVGGVREGKIGGSALVIYQTVI